MVVSSFEVSWLYNKRKKVNADKITLFFSPKRDRPAQETGKLELKKTQSPPVKAVI